MSYAFSLRRPRSRAHLQSLTESNAKVVDALVTSIRRRQIIGSLNVALATAALIQNVARTVKYSTVEELISVIKAIGRRLIDANPRGMSYSEHLIDGGGLAADLSRTCSWKHYSTYR